jgi:4-amino-4-deoxy-L-arabinose transferase-like glycosyltransferase
VGERLVFRFVPFLAGVGNVWITRAAGQRFFPGDPVRVAFAVAFAGLVPMNVYMSAYVSNEPLHGFFASLALLAASVLLLRPGGSTRWAAATGACLGLALLTKFTSVLLVPCVCFFVAAKLLVIDRAGFARALGQMMLIAGVVTAIAGWFYVRNWLHFGDPFAWNVDLPGHTSYWQQPGFHTPGYYLRFGEVLAHPWYAGFASFWDGVYATLWGDGFVGGCAYLRDRHPAWNYAFVSIGYLLALPAMLVAMVGFVRCVANSLRGDDLPARALRAFHTTVGFGIGFSVLYMTLRLPFWGQSKAFYGLCALVPLSLVAGEGLGWLRDWLDAPRWQWLRLLFWGWLGALSGVIVLSFLG